MAHDRSGPDELHLQAISDSSKSVYRCLRGTPTVCTPHKGPEMVSSAPLCGSVSTASPLPSVVSPSRHLAPPSGLSHHHFIVITALPCSLFDARAASAPSLGARSASAPFCARPALPLSLRPRAASAPFFAPLPPPIRTPANRAVLTFVFILHAFRVLPSFPVRLQPGCSLSSCSFLEASAGLRCRSPPACGGAPGAVLVFFADHCFILRTIRQR